MTRPKFTEEQIVGAIKQHEAGAKTQEICRKLGISQQTLYNWKSKFGGTVLPHSSLDYLPPSVFARNAL